MRTRKKCRVALLFAFCIVFTYCQKTDPESPVTLAGHSYVLVGIEGTDKSPEARTMERFLEDREKYGVGVIRVAFGRESDRSSILDTTIPACVYDGCNYGGADYRYLGTDSIELRTYNWTKKLCGKTKSVNVGFLFGRVWYSLTEDTLRLGDRNRGVGVFVEEKEPRLDCRDRVEYRGSKS